MTIFSPPERRTCLTKLIINATSCSKRGKVWKTISSLPNFRDHLRTRRKLRVFDRKTFSFLEIISGLVENRGFLIWLSFFLFFWPSHCQRWSRGHKARGQGQGQGHKKNPRPRPRPRTAFSRTEPLEAKDRNARGQGQGPRTQAQVFSEKKVFKNFFQAISNSLAYPEFLIGGGLNHKSHAMTSSKFFQRGSFCLTKIS